MRSSSRALVATFTLLVSVLAFPAFGQTAPLTQTPRSSSVGIGIKGGPLFSTLTSTDAKRHFKLQSGLLGGLFIGGNGRGVPGGTAELLYERKVTADADSGQITTLTYLAVPVLVRFKLTPSQSQAVKVYALVGPTFDFLVASSAMLGGVKTDLTKSIQNSDVGLVVGAGVEVARFILEGRYTGGLQDVTSANPDVTVQQTVHAQSFALLFGVRFN